MPASESSSSDARALEAQTFRASSSGFGVITMIILNIWPVRMST